VSANDTELIRAATCLLTLRHSSVSKTSYGLRTAIGRVFVALNVRIPGAAPCSICAEQVAAGMAVANGESEIECVVSIGIWRTGQPEVLMPCVMCREFLTALGNRFNIPAQS